MNTKAWDEFIKLEEEADNILIGPSTEGRVGKYVSTRQRLKAPTAGTLAPPEPQSAQPVAKSRRPLERVQPSASNQRWEKMKVVELAKQRHDVVAAIAKATGAGVVVANSSRVAVAKPIPGVDKRKQPKRKIAK